MKFPDNFYKIDHAMGFSAKHWIPIGQKIGQHNPSIIGGGKYLSFMGVDGISSFEMQLDGEIYKPVSIDEINELIAHIPVLSSN